MDPVLGAALLAIVFAGTHVGLATLPIRTRLVARLGEWGFRWLFFAVAAASFGTATAYYAAHRADGAPGPALGTVSPGLRWLLVSMVVAGVTLIVAGIWRYSGSPYDVEHPNPSRQPRGLERVTRHPFLVGVTLFATAHALLATHLIGSVLMGVLAALAIVGARHQDGKLARLRGQAFRDYVASTSAVPFAAIVGGRQSLQWREMPLGGIAVGLGVAVLLRQVHDQIFAHGGLWVAGVAVGGALAIMVAAWLRDRPKPLASRKAA
jgi:uncharacterized membrane protein